MEIVRSGKGSVPPESESEASWEELQGVLHCECETNDMGRNRADHMKLWLTSTDEEQACSSFAAVVDSGAMNYTRELRMWLSETDIAIDFLPCTVIGLSKKSPDDSCTALWANLRSFHSSYLVHRTYFEFDKDGNNGDIAQHYLSCLLSAWEKEVSRTNCNHTILEHCVLMIRDSLLCGHSSSAVEFLQGMAQRFLKTFLANIDSLPEHTPQLQAVEVACTILHFELEEAKALLQALGKRYAGRKFPPYTGMPGSGLVPFIITIYSAITRKHYARASYTAELAAFVSGTFEELKDEKLLQEDVASGVSESRLESDWSEMLNSGHAVYASRSDGLRMTATVCSSSQSMVIRIRDQFGWDVWNLVTKEFPRSPDLPAVAAGSDDGCPIEVAVYPGQIAQIWIGAQVTPEVFQIQNEPHWFDSCQFRGKWTSTEDNLQFLGGGYSLRDVRWLLKHVSLATEIRIIDLSGLHDWTPLRVLAIEDLLLELLNTVGVVERLKIPTLWCWRRIREVCCIKLRSNHRSSATHEQTPSRTTNSLCICDAIVPIKGDVPKMGDLDCIARLGSGIGVRVAILDTGLNIQRFGAQELNAIVECRSFTSSNPVASTAQHGNHCLRMLLDVAPQCEIYFGQVLGNDGVGSADALAVGISWAVSKGCKVISLSVGTPYDHEALFEAVLEAQRHKIHIVCAAANGGAQQTTNILFPGRYGGTICVGASTADGHPASFSSRGQEVDFIARGESVRVGSEVVSGTSIAAPFVGGVIAVILSHFYDADGPRLKQPLSCHQMKQLLKDMCSHPGYHNQSDGYGVFHVSTKYTRARFLLETVLDQLDEDQQLSILGKKKKREDRADRTAEEIAKKTLGVTKQSRQRRVTTGPFEVIVNNVRRPNNWFLTIWEELVEELEVSEIVAPLGEKEITAALPSYLQECYSTALDFDPAFLENVLRNKDLMEDKYHALDYFVSRVRVKNEEEEEQKMKKKKEEAARTSQYDQPSEDPDGNAERRKCKREFLDLLSKHGDGISQGATLARTKDILAATNYREFVHTGFLFAQFEWHDGTTSYFCGAARNYCEKCRDYCPVAKNSKCVKCKGNNGVTHTERAFFQLLKELVEQEDSSGVEKGVHHVLIVMVITKLDMCKACRECWKAFKLVVEGKKDKNGRSPRVALRLVGLGTQ